MRDVPAADGQPAYLEVMLPLVENGRHAGAVRIGYSTVRQERRIAQLRERQQQILGNAFTLVLLVTVLLVVVGVAIFWLLSRSITMPIARLSELAARVGEGDLGVESSVDGRDEVASLSKRFNEMVRGLRERQQIKEAFGRYLGPGVSDHILAGKVELGGEDRVCTVLFSDMRGFTTLSETMTPREVVEMLNTYFERMVAVVFENGGMLDKFMGDGLMAVFGAPTDDPEHAFHAVRAALRMREELVEVNAELRARGLPEVQIGVGLHTGHVTVGNIGSSKRTEYTAIGDTVNLASRLEGLTKQHGVDIVMSDATRDAVGARVESRVLGETPVKGKAKPVQMHAVLALSEGTPRTSTPS